MFLRFFKINASIIHFILLAINVFRKSNSIKHLFSLIIFAILWPKSLFKLFDDRFKFSTLLLRFKKCNKVDSNVSSIEQQLKFNLKK